MTNRKYKVKQPPAFYGNLLCQMEQGKVWRARRTSTRLAAGAVQNWPSEKDEAYLASLHALEASELNKMNQIAKKISDGAYHPAGDKETKKA